MYTEINPLFFVFGIRFLFSVFFAWIIPGFVLVRGQKISILAKLSLALPTGIGLWGLAGLLFGLMRMRFLFYPYILLFVFLFFRQFSFSRIQLLVKTSIDPILSFILISGTALQVLSVWFMGVLLGDSVRYCCGHIPDNHLFLALANEFTHRFPAFEPGVYGAVLQNYHYLSHLVVADFVNTFRLPLPTTSYQFIPFVISLSLGLSALGFSSVLRLGCSFKRWILFFLYVGADAVFIILFLTRGAFPFALNAMEAGTGILFNYPRAFSIVILITGLAWISLWYQKKHLLAGIVAVILLGTAYGYKAFTGLFIWPGLALLGLVAVWKKDIRSALMLTAALAIGLALHLSTNGESGGMFFSGMWRIHDLFGMREVGLSHILLARQIFYDHNNWLRVAIADTAMAIIFLAATFGTKLIALIQTPRSLKKFPIEIHILLLSGLASSFILGMFTLQSKGGSTTVNFLITVFIMLSFYSALSLSYVFTNMLRLFFWILALIIIITTIPRSLWMTYKNSRDISIPVSRGQHFDLTLFKNIQTNTPINSLILPIGFSLTYENLWMKYFTDRNIYISGNFRGPIVTTMMKYRENVLQQVQTTQDPFVLHALLKRENIQYLLFQKGSTISAQFNTTVLKPLYSSPNYDFFEVVP